MTTNHTVMTFQDGVNTAMRTLQSNISQQSTKTFTNTQKGRIMGLFGVTRWNEVPKIWNKIEACKTDEDLHVVLMTYWENHKGSLSILHYRI